MAPPFEELDRVAIPSRSTLQHGGPQDVQNQTRAGQEAASEPLHSSVDAYENGKQHQIQLEAKNVAKNEARPMS